MAPHLKWEVTRLDESGDTKSTTHYRTLYEVCEAVGCSRSTVWSILKDPSRKRRRYARIKFNRVRLPIDTVQPT